MSRHLFLAAILNLGCCLQGFTASVTLADNYVEENTLDLESEYANIQYCLSNIGRPFSELDPEKIGSDKGFREFTPIVTYGLIAVKFEDDYGNNAQAAKYFYMDWLEYEKCKKARLDQTRETPCDAFGSGPGDYFPLRYAIGQWKYAGMYKKALQHYSEYFDDTFLDQPGNGAREERLKYFAKAKENDPELKQRYLDFMNDWEETRKLAQNSSIKPADPVVQNHIWFHSGKRKEVLKALAYYHKHNVRFMLEKALKHKDPSVAAKAKEYLGSLAKDKGDGDDKKN